jgi:serine/threonine protein kinase
MNLNPETVLTGEGSDATRTLTAPSPKTIAPLFPHLEILETLGRGGMGIVYKARQRALDRLVALKILAPEKEHDAEFAARFAQEAQALARLSHPQIVTIHDFGEVKAPDGRALFYLLMEFVDGVNLRQVLRTRRLAPEEALAIVPTICDALQYAHSRGIVHRDIKPENLLLDKEGKVKIADFGIAKIVGADTTAENRSAGTPEYMAPEQRSAPERVDHRADIYSLGVVLYEMLTGELPSKKLEAPSSRVTGVHFDVRLDEIVLRALHAEPELRYHTALDLKTQIEAIAPTQRPETVAAHNLLMNTESAPSNVRQRAPFSVKQRGLIAGALLGTVLVLSAPLLTFLVRPRYFARVTMEVHPDYSRSFGTSSNDAENAYFVWTQSEILSKSELLVPVIQSLDLRKTFPARAGEMSIDDVRARIAASLAVRAIRNTGLFEVGIYADEPGLAANIANALAAVYQQKRLANWQSIVAMQFARFTEDINKLRKRIETARESMETIRVRAQLADPDPESLAAPVQAVTQEDASATPENAKRAAYLEAKLNYLQAKKLLEAAQTKFATDQLQRGVDFLPVKIWERAEPPPRASSPAWRHVWYALRFPMG